MLVMETHFLYNTGQFCLTNHAKISENHKIMLPEAAYSFKTKNK